MTRDGNSANSEQAAQAFKSMQAAFKEMGEQMRRYDGLVKLHYRGFLPLKWAARLETRAYWRARLQAWDETYGDEADLETLALRGKWAGIVGVR